MKKDAPDEYVEGIRGKNWVWKCYNNFRAYFHFGSVNKVPFRGSKSKIGAIYFGLRIIF